MSIAERSEIFNTEEGTATATDNDVTCRVRILQRLYDDGTRVTDPNKSPGHYDLMLFASGPIGSNSDGSARQYSSPVVISYGQGGSNELAFFNPERQHKVYDGLYIDFYHWDFKAKRSQVNAMIKWLFAFGLKKKSFDDYNNKLLARYRVTKGKFKTYSRTNANCLMAVGAMCKKMGNATISNLITAKGGAPGDNHKYWEYYPYSLLPQYYDNASTRVWKHDGKKDFR